MLWYYREMLRISYYLGIFLHCPSAALIIVSFQILCFVVLFLFQIIMLMSNSLLFLLKRRLKLYSIQVPQNKTLPLHRKQKQKIKVLPSSLPLWFEPVSFYICRKLLMMPFSFTCTVIAENVINKIKSKCVSKVPV